MTNKFLKSALSLLAVTLLSTNVQASNYESCSNLNTKLEKDAKGLIKIKIDAGRKSKGCTGFGVCSFSAGADFGIIEIEIVYGDQTKMTANVSEVSQKNIKEHFGKNAFILEEDFEITDAKTKEALGIRNFTIKKGVYEVRDGKVTFLSTAN